MCITIDDTLKAVDTIGITQIIIIIKPFLIMSNEERLIV